MDVVEVCVFDVGGRLVKRLARGTFDPGEHFLVWDGTDREGRAVASGVYLVRSRVGQDENQSRSLVVLR